MFSNKIWVSFFKKNLSFYIINHNFETHSKLRTFVMFALGLSIDFK